MSKGDDGATSTTRAKETEDLFPVRDIETDSRELVTPRYAMNSHFKFQFCEVHFHVQCLSLVTFRKGYFYFLGFTYYYHFLSSN